MLLLGTLLLSGVAITLPSKALVDGTEITLGQIAAVTGDDPEEVAKIRSLELGYAPSPGFSRVVEAWKIDAQVTRMFKTIDVSFVGENSCRVQPAVAIITGTELHETAHKMLERFFAEEDVMIRSVGTLHDEKVPKGMYGRSLYSELGSGASTGTKQNAGNWSVPVQILVDGAPYRTVWTEFEVQIYKVIPVLGRDVAQGQAIGRGDMVMKRTAITAGFNANMLRERDLIGALAKRPLRKDEPIASKDVMRIPAIKKDELATLSVVKGGISVTVQVAALEDGFLDDQISVQVSGSLKELTVTVAARGRLELVLRKN
ncbi:MAG: flagella basal body P-ring formation protein FlgA [Planctomycetota bacterium]|jgi:flagella basal body P-ring formation protein FlgA